jgi:hypothetical protein
MRTCNRNEYTLKPWSTRINWRASLVPAAAVIPAPIAYIKVVAVKKLVVGSVSSRRRTTRFNPAAGSSGSRGASSDCLRRASGTSCRWRCPVRGSSVKPLPFLVRVPSWPDEVAVRVRHVYFEQIRVLKAGSKQAVVRPSGRWAVLTAMNMVAWNNGIRPRSRLYAVTTQRVESLPSRRRLRARVACRGTSFGVA